MLRPLLSSGCLNLHSSLYKAGDTPLTKDQGQRGKTEAPPGWQRAPAGLLLPTGLGRARGWGLRLHMLPPLELNRPPLLPTWAKAQESSNLDVLE